MLALDYFSVQKVILNLSSFLLCCLKLSKLKLIPQMYFNNPYHNYYSGKFNNHIFIILIISGAPVRWKKTKPAESDCNEIPLSSM